MTSDYVSWVLGLQGWERAWRKDSYFAGEEGTLGSSVEPDTPEKGFLGPSTVTVGCQTPAEWADLEPAQQAPQVKPRRALERKGAIDAGTSPPHTFFRTAFVLCNPF